MEGLERLKDQMQIVGKSIAKAVSDRALFINYDTNPIPSGNANPSLIINFEYEKVKSTDNVDSAQAATVTSHKDWHKFKSVDISRKKGLSSLFSSFQAQKETLEVANKKRLKAHEAFQKYHKQSDTRKSGHQADLMQTPRFDLSAYGISTKTKPRTIPQFNPAPSSGQTSVVRLGLD